MVYGNLKVNILAYMPIEMLNGFCVLMIERALVVVHYFLGTNWFPGTTRNKTMCHYQLQRYNI